MPYADPQKRQRYQRQYMKKYREKQGLLPRGPGRPRKLHPIGQSAREPARTRDEQNPERKILMGARVRETLYMRLRRMLDDALAKGLYPWKNQTDMMIDLMERGVLHLKDHHEDEELDAFAKSVELRRKVSKFTTARLDMQTLYQQTVTELHAMIDMGDRDTAVRVYHDAVEAFQEMPATVYRDHMLARLEKQFPKLAKATPAAIQIGNGKGKRKGGS